MSAIAKNGIIYQGGTPVIDILNSDLQALIQAGTYDPNVLYNITDLNDNENIIDDENVSNNTTWSSSKINSKLGQLNSKNIINYGVYNENNIKYPFNKNITDGTLLVVALGSNGVSSVQGIAYQLCTLGYNNVKSANGRLNLYIETDGFTILAHEGSEPVRCIYTLF